MDSVVAFLTQIKTMGQNLRVNNVPGTMTKRSSDNDNVDHDTSVAFQDVNDRGKLGIFGHGPLATRPGWHTFGRLGNQVGLQGDPCPRPWGLPGPRGKR